MGEYVLTLLAAAAVTYLLTPLVRRFAIAIGAMHAARDRDVHVVPTPLLGGFAMYAGLAVGLIVASGLPSLESVFAETNMAKGLLLAGGLVVVMGFVDDRWGMGVISKLAGQVAAGVILVWSGAEVTWLPTPGGTTLGLTSDQQIALTILVVVVTINAVNFIDGLDGLAAGIVGIGAVAFFAYYYTLTHRLGLPDQAAPALASAVLAGICLGFLPHNYHPARIFMGDTGAMLIGLLLAYAPISSLASLDPGSLTDTRALSLGTVNRFGAILPLLLPAAILLIPYADLLMAVFRRARAGLSPFAPDRKHLHHRMLDIGHSHQTSVLIMYLWAAVFAGSVVWLSIVRTPLVVLVIITVGAMLALLFASMPRLRPWARHTAGTSATGVSTVPSSPAEPPTASATGAPGTGAPATRQAAVPSAAAPSAEPPSAGPPSTLQARRPAAHAQPPPDREPVQPALAPAHQAPALHAAPAPVHHAAAPAHQAPVPDDMPAPHAPHAAPAPAHQAPAPAHQARAPAQQAAAPVDHAPAPVRHAPGPSWDGSETQPSASSPPWPPAPPAPSWPPMQPDREQPAPPA
jgi:UDP-GlcNAc:undecaprenyl-phosphate/decaprenyl-phosphate GlcNAc-1-phosphate transferase